MDETTFNLKEVLDFHTGELPVKRRAELQHLADNNAEWKDILDGCLLLLEEMDMQKESLLQLLSKQKAIHQKRFQKHLTKRLR